MRACLGIDSIQGDVVDVEIDFTNVTRKFVNCAKLIKKEENHMYLIILSISSTRPLKSKRNKRQKFQEVK